MILEEEHAGEDDVGLLDVLAAALERPGVVAELGRRMQPQLEARHLLAQGHPGTGEGTSRVVVQGDDRHPDRNTASLRLVSGRNALWHRTRSRR